MSVFIFFVALSDVVENFGDDTFDFRQKSLLTIVVVLWPALRAGVRVRARARALRLRARRLNNDLEHATVRIRE